MAHIAIFCDGTWSSAHDGSRTHVLRLSSACQRSDAQKVLYFDGVGTGTGMTSRFGRWISRIGGGLFGWGLNRNIKTAYGDLCKVYRPGDKIMIFGFSRGAYTARSLVGMIRKCGILQFPTHANVARAFKLYRLRGPENAPDASLIHAQRRRLSPQFATSQADIMARQDDSALVRISYLGVWDTVGALGIPESFFGGVARWWNKRYEFHDTRLTHLVEAARHASALDERRVFFKPSQWDNLTSQGGVPGLNGADNGPNRPYQQKWFVGDHGSVGGSRGRSAYSEATLSWIRDGAVSGGLLMASDMDAEPAPKHAEKATIDQAETRWVYKLFPWLLKWRAGPEHPWDLDDSVRLHVAGEPTYRPGSLTRLMPGLLRRGHANVPFSLVSKGRSKVGG
ncbi:MAG: DUF2235 domain-containing protein [Paracoccaceae bacterium]|nr:DUF2235 domain-containing protein [Paracoccaceae bacterium]